MAIMLNACLQSIPLVSNVLCAVGIVLINKWIVIVDNFRFMSTLSCLHFYSSFVGCCFMLMLGLFRYKTASYYGYIFCICLGSLSSTIFMNLSLATNSVGFYQLSKLGCIPVTLIFETILAKRQQDLTPQMIFSLFAILLSIYLFGSHDIHFNLPGAIWASLAIISSSLSQIFFGPISKELGMNALQLLYHTSPIMTVGAFVLIPIFDNGHELMNTDIRFNLLFDIFLSCLSAFLLNISNYYVLSQVSPLTYQVLSHVKTIAIISFGYLLFDKLDLPTGGSWTWVWGLALALVGIVLYTQENQRQTTQKLTQACTVAISSALTQSFSSSSSSSVNGRKGGGELGIGEGEEMMYVFGEEI